MTHTHSHTRQCDRRIFFFRDRFCVQTVDIDSLIFDLIVLRVYALCVFSSVDLWCAGEWVSVFIVVVETGIEIYTVQWFFKLPFHVRISTIITNSRIIIMKKKEKEKIKWTEYIYAVLNKNLFFFRMLTIDICSICMHVCSGCVCVCLCACLGASEIL